MQALQRFESFVERLMEGSFARLFRSPIQPAEIAKRLEREMEAHPTISVGRTYVPNHYTVTLHPDDFAEFEPFRHSLEHNMAEFISDLASERGYSLVSRPRVTLKLGEGVPKRSIELLTGSLHRGCIAAAGRDLVALRDELVGGQLLILLGRSKRVEKSIPTYEWRFERKRRAMPSPQAASRMDRGRPSASCSTVRAAQRYRYPLPRLASRTRKGQSHSLSGRFEKVLA